MEALDQQIAQPLIQSSAESGLNPQELPATEPGQANPIALADRLKQLISERAALTTRKEEQCSLAANADERKKIKKRFKKKLKKIDQKIAQLERDMQTSESSSIIEETPHLQAPIAMAPVPSPAEAAAIQ